MWLLILLPLSSCDGRSDTAAPQPWILLVTLDTTRADALTQDVAPVFTNVAATGRRFAAAHATVPETLPSHTSMMTGLYPGGHGVHENGRFVAADHVLLAAELQKAGYSTTAVVSAYVLARRFGLARGFDTYDDDQGAGATERTASATTDKAISLVQSLPEGRPAFFWAHYFDAHAPYVPPAPYREAFAGRPYLGEAAYVDAQMGRLIGAFEARAAEAGREVVIIVTSDHGEGLGEHGEAQHGHLVYQSTMHVPLAMRGPGLAPGEVTSPVSTRRLFHTVLDWAGRPSPESLRAPVVASEVVLGEAMKPFLQYGWQPQIMAVDTTTKAILAGPIEVYDLAADPREAQNLRTGATLPAPLRTALDDYPVPSLAPATADSPMDSEARQKLAALGYVSATTAPVVRRDAPRPADMVHVLPLIEEASTLFVQGRYAAVIPVLQKILTADPNHLDATMRLATSYSALGQDARAIETFRKAAQLAPSSPDVRLYLALHYARGTRWAEAVPLLEEVLKGQPERLAALEALAQLRERQGRHGERLDLLRRVYALRPMTADEAIGFGMQAMALQQTDQAIRGFEQARGLQGGSFRHDLELGVLYLAGRRLQDARAALDRIAPTHPDYAMVLFKRAQVSVLLNEPDRAARIEAARRGADATTRALIANERLFR